MDMEEIIDGDEMHVADGNTIEIGQTVDEDGVEVGQTFTLTTEDGITYVFHTNESGASLVDHINQLRVFPSENGPVLGLASDFEFDEPEIETNIKREILSPSHSPTPTESALEEQPETATAAYGGDLTLWPLAKTEALLAAMRKYQNMFRGGLKRRKRIWECVSQEFERSSGYKCDRDECSKKWHNLFRTYKKVHDKHGNNSSWELYKPMKDLVKALNWPNTASVLKKKPLNLRTNQGISKLLQAIKCQSAQRKACLKSFMEKVKELEKEKNGIIGDIGNLLRVSKEPLEVSEIVAGLLKATDMSDVFNANSPSPINSHRVTSPKQDERKTSELKDDFQATNSPETSTQENGSLELGMPLYVLADDSTSNISRSNRSLRTDKNTNGPYYYLSVGDNPSAENLQQQYGIVCTNPDELD